MRRDLVRFTPIALVLVLIVLWFAFRTVRGVVLPVLTVGGALVWTLGIIVLAGKTITPGTSILPPLLLVVGSSYAIHVMARYYEQVAAGAPPDEVVVRAFARVWLPLTISAVATVIGFGSLMVNRITAIWDLGLFAVVGRSEEHTSELQSLAYLVCRLLLEKKKKKTPHSSSAYCASALAK